MQCLRHFYLEKENHQDLQVFFFLHKNMIWVFTGIAHKDFPVRTHNIYFFVGIENHKHIQAKKMSCLELNTCNVQPASVAHLDALSDWRPGGRGVNPR